MRALVVLGGDWPPSLTTQHLAESFKVLIAADAGFRHIVEHEMQVDAVIGDLDSVDQNSVPSSIHLLHVQDQDSSDCDKALQYASELGCSGATIVAWEGGRLDHQLAVLQSALKSSLKVDLISSEQRAFLVRGDFEIGCPAGRICSLIPLNTCTGVHLDGVRWSLQNEELTPGVRWSLSNVSEGPVAVRIESGAALFCIQTTFEESESWSISQD